MTWLGLTAAIAVGGLAAAQAHWWMQAWLFGLHCDWSREKERKWLTWRANRRQEARRA